MKLKLLCSAAVGALFLFAACSDNSAGKKVFIEDGVYEADMYESKTAGSPADSFSESSGSFTGLPLERKLIKTGDIEFKTADLKEERSAIDRLIKKHNAYIQSENEQAYGRRVVHELSIRIPKDKFDMFLTELLGGIKRIDNKNITIEDVTEEFIDITARLNVKKAAENRYLQLLTQAKTIKDILEIENQIQALRSEIESIEGRLKYLENSVHYSSLTVRMYEEDTSAVVLTYPSFVEKIFEALRGSIEILESLFIGLIYLWPFVILAVLGVVFFVRKAKKKIAQNGAETSAFDKE